MSATIAAPPGRTPPTADQLLTAAELKAEGTSWKLIAEDLGVDEPALRWWRRDHPADWAAAYAEGRRHIRGDVLGEALFTLRKNMRCGKPRVEVDAAGQILRYWADDRKTRRPAAQGDGPEENPGGLDHEQVEHIARFMAGRPKPLPPLPDEDESGGGDGPPRDTPPADVAPCSGSGEGSPAQNRPPASGFGGLAGVVGAFALLGALAVGSAVAARPDGRSAFGRRTAPVHDGGKTADRGDFPVRAARPERPHTPVEQPAVCGMLNRMNTIPYEPAKSTLGDEPPVAAAAAPAVPGYEVQELVGRGGMGKVYRARHVELNRTVALKVLAHEPDERALARFRAEARTVAQLQHPNIAQLYDTGTADHRPYLAQEFVDGGTLARRFGGAPQDPAFVAAVVETVARAVQHSHDHGILHRDLKPGNVLLAADGTPKVTDFGLAKLLAADGTAETPSGGDALTRTGEILGTPGYMPPEQASGVTSALGPAADVYSLGAILYEGLTGRPPFQAAEPLQTLLLVLGMDPVAPRALLPKLPRDLETICLKCLEKSPTKRYPTAKELADDLRRWRSGEPIAARPVGFAERAGKWARRKKAQAALAAVSAAFAVAVTAASAWLGVSNARLTKLNADLGAAKADLERTNADLEKAKGETETMLGFALNTMDEYHFTLADKLKELPKGEKLRIEVLKQAHDTLDKMFTQNPKRRSVLEHLAYGYQHLGNALGQVGDLPGSEAAFRRSREAVDRLLEAHPDDVRYRTARGIDALQLALTLDLQGKTAEADALRDDGEGIAAELDAAHPDDEDVVKLNLLAHSRPAMRAAAVGTPEAMEPLYRRWADLYHRLARLRPDVPRHAMSAVENELALARLLAQQKKFDEADGILGRAKGAVAALPDSDAPAVRQLRATYHDSVANVHYQRGRSAEADAEYRTALAEYERLATDFPSSPNYRRMVVNTWYSIGSVGTFGGDPEEGAKAFRTARELAAALVRDYPNDRQMKELLDGIERTTRSLPEKK